MELDLEEDDADFGLLFLKLVSDSEYGMLLFLLSGTQLQALVQ